MPTASRVSTADRPDSPQLSVVIATYKRADQLNETLESLSRQSTPAKLFEVIVVDNASDDATEAVARSFLERQSHWRMLRERKPGAAAARNAGVKASRGEIILFLDDDIVADPQLVEQHLASHRAHSGAAVLGAVRFPWKGDENAFLWCLQRHPELFQSFQFSDHNNVPFQYFYTCNLSLPHSFLDQADGFDESFIASGFEDIELGYRFIRAGFRIVFNEEASALHDVRTTFQKFSQKRYASGQWAQYLVRKYPELHSVIWQRRSLKATISDLLGFSATPFGPLFEIGEGLFRPLLPVLGRFCWHHLQYRFRAGCRTNALSTAGMLAKTKRA